ncbi:MAG TPA: TMEM175 family protein [Thermoanaerobaculia bacterium]|nr:TMEM175 family protein [Thermoanaerobaculia bacterium]
MAKGIAFRNRGHEVSRLEAFSDVIFGFAVSLLVVSLEAPKSYEQLMEMMHGLLPFAFCFFLFIDMWLEHHHFFRRYALHDNLTIFINTVLLFVILFYVYPLKFMFTLMAEGLTGGRTSIPAGSGVVLFTIYGIGFTSVFWLLAALYWRAWQQRDELALNEVERVDTLERIFDNLCTGVFGLISIAIARTTGSGWAGLIYFFLAVPKTLVPTIMGRKRRKAEARMADATAAPALATEAAAQES